MLGKLIKSKAWIAGGGLLLVLTVYYLGKETYRKWEIKQEVKRLETEIAAVEDKNKEILELINYYKTTEYKERQARSILGLAKPGEFVVSLPARENQGANATSTSSQGSNFWQWWDYFFGDHR